MGDNIDVMLNLFYKFANMSTEKYSLDIAAYKYCQLDLSYCETNGDICKTNGDIICKTNGDICNKSAEGTFTIPNEIWIRILSLIWAQSRNARCLLRVASICKQTRIIARTLFAPYLVKFTTNNSPITIFGKSIVNYISPSRAIDNIFKLKKPITFISPRFCVIFEKNGITVNIDNIKINMCKCNKLHINNITKNIGHKLANSVKIMYKIIDAQNWTNNRKNNKLNDNTNVDSICHLLNKVLTMRRTKDKITVLAPNINNIAANNPAVIPINNQFITVTLHRGVIKTKLSKYEAEIINSISVHVSRMNVEEII